MTLSDAHMAQIAGVLDRLSLTRGEASLYVVLAMADKLTACAGDDALATLSAMGLTQVEVDV